MWARDIPLVYLDEYWRVSKDYGFDPKDLRKMVLSRTWFIEGKQSDVDHEELRMAVESQCYTLAGSSETVIDWGYLPTTDEVDVLFHKG